LPQGVAGNVTFQKTDLTKWSDQMDLFGLAISKFGHIDIVFLNAGIYETEDIFVDKFEDNDSSKNPNIRC
jgi:NAD(P)-dependent dehydrogenase (short-subunit alcohol dehydrogenase family)